MENLSRFSVIGKHDSIDSCMECLDKEGQIKALRMLLKIQEDMSRKMARMVGAYERIYGVNESINEKFFGKQSFLKIVR